VGFLWPPGEIRWRLFDVCNPSRSNPRRVFLLQLRGESEMTSAVRFNELVKFNWQSELVESAERAAAANGVRPSEWWRQAGRAALRASGIDPVQVSQSKDAA
jgi:hypothetical protein